MIKKKGCCAYLFLTIKQIILLLVDVLYKWLICAHHVPDTRQTVNNKYVCDPVYNYCSTYFTVIQPICLRLMLLVGIQINLHDVKRK